MTLAWVTPAEAPAMAAAHARAFAHPWTAEAFAELLASPGVYGVLCADGLGLFRAVAGEMEVLTIGVDPARRRTGLARIMMTAAIEAARQAGAEESFLEVAVGNAAAIALYASLGFHQAGVRRGYYDLGAKGTEDALVMRLDLRAFAP